MIGISTGFVCHGQYWLVYQSVLSAVDNNGWFIFQFCMSWTILVGISPSFVCHGQYWLVYLPVLSSLTILAGISPVFVCRGQYWVVYLSVVSVMDNIGWYITQFCLPWTIMVGIYWLVYQLLWSVCHGQ